MNFSEDMVFLSSHVIRLAVVLLLAAAFKVSYYPEPEFVNLFGAQESIPAAYVAWRADT